MPSPFLGGMGEDLGGGGGGGNYFVAAFVVSSAVRLIPVASCSNREDCQMRGLATVWQTENSDDEVGLHTHTHTHTHTHI